MSFLDIVFDFLDGVFLGVRIITPFFVSFACWFYIEHVMAKDKGAKSYQQFLAFVPVIAVWVMVDPQSIPESFHSLSFFGIIPAGIIIVLGGYSVLSMATREKSKSEEDAEKLRSENNYLKDKVKTLEAQNKYYEHLLDNEKP